MSEPVNPMFADPTYLGDGVYAGHDGYQIWLHANHHANPTDRIALEPSVMDALIRYATRLRNKRNEHNEQPQGDIT